MANSNKKRLETLQMNELTQKGRCQAEMDVRKNKKQKTKTKKKKNNNIIFFIIYIYISY